MRPMLSRRKKIAITVKLFGGIDTDTGLTDYDPDIGMDLQVPEGIRLRKAIKKIGLNQINSMALFINGKQVGLRERLNDGDVVFCMKPLAGG